MSKTHSWQVSNHKVAVGLAVIVLATLVAYIPAMRAGYIWDDDAYVKDNQTLRSLDGLGRIWFEIGATPQYYPLVHSSYWLEYQLWGLNPAGYHIVNIILHIVSAVLLWRVLVILGVPAAWAAAAIFALHPVHVESVAWITERKNVLSGVFYIGSALAYLHYALIPATESDRSRAGRFYTASLVLFVCALLSKTVTFSLPAALLLVLWWKRKEIGWPDVRVLIPFFVFGIAFGLLTTLMEKYRVGAVGEEWAFSLIERCLIAGRVLFFYAGRLCWPKPLIFIYPRWHIDAGIWWQYLFPAAAVVSLAALWLARRRIGSGALAAVLFFAGTLVPALGFFDVYPMRFSFVADHFQYLASIGIITLIVVMGYRASYRLGGQVKVVAAMVLVFVLASCGILTWRQCRVYKNLETLWCDTIRQNPDAWIAHTNLGLVLKSQNRIDEAIGCYNRALELKSDNAEAHNNLASALEVRGRLDEALGHYRQALRIKPDYIEVHINLGNALAAAGRFDEAAGHYRRVLQLEPDYAEIHRNLGLALKFQGKVDEAISHYRRALQIMPEEPDTHSNLATALASQGKLDEAISHYQQVLSLRPDDAETHYNIGLAFKRQGKLTEAAEHYRYALRVKADYLAPLNGIAEILTTHPDENERDSEQAIVFAERAAKLTGYQNATILETLAAAYASAGRFDSAIATIQRALAPASAAGDNKLTNHLRKQLELYRQKRPQIEPVRIEDEAN